MALTNKAITLISFFALFLLSIEAQLAPSPSEDLETDFSYISSSPDASPASAPSSGEEDLTILPSYISSSPGGSPASAPGSSEFGPGGEEGLLQEMQLPDVSLMALTDDSTMESQAQVAQTIKKSMQVIEQKLIEFNAILKKRLYDPKTSASTQECIKQCAQVHMDAVNKARDSVNSLMSGNFQQANTDINAISTKIDTCEQSFNEMVGEDPELKKFDEWVKGMITQALGSLEQVSS